MKVSLLANSRTCRLRLGRISAPFTSENISMALERVMTRPVLADVYDKMFQELTKRFPNGSPADEKLLKELLDLQREGGKAALQDRLKEMIEKIGAQEDSEG